MIRVLTFDGPKAPRRFELILTAVLSGGSPGGDGKSERSPQIIRKEARLQDALDLVSTPAASSNGNDPATARALIESPPPMSISQEDFELLQLYTERVPWSPRISREVCDLWDWLSAAERRD